MEVAIHHGQIILPEEILKKAYFPKEGDAELLVGEREIRISLPASRREVIPDAVMKIIKHLEGPHPKRSIDEMAMDSEVTVD